MAQQGLRAVPRTEPQQADATRLVDLALDARLPSLPCHDTPLGRYDNDLRVLADDHETDLASVGMAILLVLLQRHSGSSELTIGFDCSGVSPFAEDVGLEFSLQESESFSQLVQQVVLQRLSQPLPSSGTKTRTSACIGFASVDSDPGALPEARELQAMLFQSSSGSLVRLRGDGRRYDQDHLSELGAQFMVVLRQVGQRPQLPLGAITLVTAGSREVMPDPARLLAMPRHAPLTEAVLDWARRTPQATAIRHAGRSLSYADVAHASARIARQLCAEGVQSGHVVAVTGRRSPGFVVAMLAVWRSGGALLTLDPKLPLDRRRIMMQQAQACALVCVGPKGSDGEALEALVDTVLRVEECEGELENHAATGMVALPTLQPEHPAYVFFTSGSTGTPKGVMGRHAGLAHFLDWQRQTFGVGPGDRASQLTALSFDVVLRDTFLALTSGATLCIPGERDVLDPARILGWLQREQVTTIHVVPSLARLWLTQVPEGVDLSSLRRVFFAGEPLNDVLVRRWREAFPGAFDVVNLYGPTETTLAKCYQVVPSDPEPGIQPVGRCLPQTQALLINTYGGLCGLCEIGQIAIRTPFRTLGYVNNPKAQSLAFVANPWQPEDADDLIYLTGDSGMYLPDGRLRILGRMDNQVKIRGVRIELGEIEACLLRHPDVREAVVLAVDDGHDDKHLVAYVVARSESVDEPTVMGVDLRRSLRSLLPENMVPSHFMHLRALPLNANGKIDRKALPAPDLTQSVAEAVPTIAPRTELESSVAALWCEILRIERVGIDQNFFDLGGHSLMAVQLTNLISQRLGMVCPVSLLFESPVLCAFCAALKEVVPGGQEVSIVGLKSSGVLPPLFCICGARVYQDIADHLDEDRPVYGVFLAREQLWYDRDHPDAVATEPTIEEMAAEYVAAIRVQQPHGPYHLAGLSFGGVLAFEMAQQLRAAGEEVAFLAMLDSMLPGALERDWLKWGLERLQRAWRAGWRRCSDWLVRPGAMQPSAPEYTHATLTLGQERLGQLRTAFYRRLTAGYSPRAYDRPALLSRAQDKSFFKSDIADASYGWASLIPQLEMCDVPGDHIGHIRAPNVGELCGHMRRRLGGVSG